VAQGAKAPHRRTGVPPAAADDERHRRLRYGPRFIGGYRVKIRNGPKVENERFDDLDAALAEIESRGRELARDSRTDAIGGQLIRRIEPVQQVTARLQLAGPKRLRAGIDVRGDGSAEAWTGWLRRRIVEQEASESAYDALRRVAAGAD
jgi:hypothetical protein